MTNIKGLSTRLPPSTQLAVPAAVVVAYGVHLWASAHQPAPESRAYSLFLAIMGGAAVAAGLAQVLLESTDRVAVTAPRESPALARKSGGALARRSYSAWLAHFCPIIAATILLLALWEILTSGFRLLPLPYFPSPAGVLLSLINDRRLLADSTWHSLLLLFSGYSVGVVVALVTGVCIGWFAHARYWGMPLLKIVGPIPATAWVPLAMVLAPSAWLSAVGLVALAVWFPVTMLTVSGISNTRASYLDVARTLGAGRAYLIFRVAIPAAMPSIFIGLFMGLGTSFLTLIVAETVGVKSGLGWYVSWAQGWAEYGKVFAALIIMAAFFSTIITVLFKLRDRVLAWQKGVLKW